MEPYNTEQEQRVKGKKGGEYGSGSLSNWRSVQVWKSSLARDLQQRRVLWLHGVFIGVFTLAVTWGGSPADALGRGLVAVTLGAGIDYFIPSAQTLPQALKVLQAQFGDA